MTKDDLAKELDAIRDERDAALLAELVEILLPDDAAEGTKRRIAIGFAVAYLMGTKEQGRRNEK